MRNFYLILLMLFLVLACKREEIFTTVRLSEDQKAKLPDDYFSIDSINVDVFENGGKTETKTFFLNRLHKYFMVEQARVGYGHTDDLLRETWSFEFKTRNDEILQVAVSNFEADELRYPDLIIKSKDFYLLFPLDKIEITDQDQTLVPLYEPVDLIYNTTHGIRGIYYRDSSLAWVFN